MADVGRPTDYRPEYCEMLIEHMAGGLSFESFAGTIYTTRKTLYNWLEKHPEFLHAKEQGTEKSLHYWEALGRDHILNVSETYGQNMGGKSTSLNATVYRMNMFNRFGWRDKIEHSGEIDTSATQKKVKKLLENPATAEAARTLGKALLDDDSSGE